MAEPGRMREQYHVLCTPRARRAAGGPPRLGLQHPARVGRLLQRHAQREQRELERGRHEDERGRQEERRERREARAAAQRRRLHGAPDQQRGGQRGRQLDQRVPVGEVDPAGEAAHLPAHPIPSQTLSLSQPYLEGEWRRGRSAPAACRHACIGRARCLLNGRDFACTQAGTTA